MDERDKSSDEGPATLGRFAAAAMGGAFFMLAALEGLGGLLLFVLPALLWRRYRWVAPWAIAGAFFALGVMELGTLGLIVGLVPLVVLAWRDEAARALGFLFGMGLLLTLIASNHLDYQACTAGPHFVYMAPGTHPSFGGGSCGGLDGLPLMIVGSLVVVLAVVRYLHSLHRTRHRTRGGNAPVEAPPLGA
jgi:hypothetical protein